MLALTQPAVSQQVAALERQLGVRLLDRGPGGPTPTDAGTLLLAHADAVADRLAQADQQVAELAANDRETLRVGAFPSALASVIPAAIARLRELRPELQVEASEGSGEALGAAVAAGALHAAMCFQDAEAPARRPAGTERHELGEELMKAVPRPSIRSPAAGASGCASWRTRCGRRPPATTSSTGPAWRPASSPRSASSPVTCWRPARSSGAVSR